jgi:hypothetical protein
MPQISAKPLEELIPGPVTKKQFEDIFQIRQKPATRPGSIFNPPKLRPLPIIFKK